MRRRSCEPGFQFTISRHNDHYVSGITSHTKTNPRLSVVWACMRRDDAVVDNDALQRRVARGDRAAAGSFGQAAAAPDLPSGETPTLRSGVTTFAESQDSSTAR
jgi:hypothetical protein